MASRINPVPLMALIICVIFTLIFTVLVIVKSGDVRRHMEGDPERASWKWNEKLRGEVREKTNAIREAEKSIALRKQELYRLDLQGNVRRLYYDEGELLGGVATPGAETGDVRGQQVKLKDSSWSLTQQLIRKDVEYMDGLRKEYEGPERQEFPSLDEAIKRRQDELRNVTKKIADQDAGYQADRERLAAQLEALTAERDRIERRSREDAGLRYSRINQLEDRIRELLELDLHWMIERDKEGKVTGKAGLEPDGSLLQADTQGNKVIIDKGARDRIFPGLIFEVFTFERGAYNEKGRVEVIEVQDTIAVARIISQLDSRRNTIGRGDFVGNPVFDSRNPKVFVVAGEFEHYNREDLEQFIRRTGGVVWPTLAPGANFLVAGERSEKEQADARQYQILALKEEDLLSYVQTTFAPKDKAAAK